MRVVWAERGDPATLNSCWLLLPWDRSKFFSDEDLICLLCQGRGGAGLLARKGNWFCARLMLIGFDLEKSLLNLSLLSCKMGIEECLPYKFVMGIRHNGYNIANTCLAGAQ